MAQLAIQFAFYCGLTLAIYLSFQWLQRKFDKPWFNPMLNSMLVIIPLLIFGGVPFNDYYQHTQIFSHLLEPAIVALGYPLYQQLSVIRRQIKLILLTLTSAITLMLVINMLLALYFIHNPSVAVSMSLKSVTTPIGLALTAQLNGIASFTAVAIIVAGIVGGIAGPSFLNRTGVSCAKSQGLAIGCASHAYGTACVNHLSYQHGAFASLALIVSAILTAVFSPLIITQMLSLSDPFLVN